jgi:hypothetical protein
LTKEGELPRLFNYEGKRYSILDSIGNLGRHEITRDLMIKTSLDGKLIDNEGRLVNEKGYLVDNDGNVVDKSGK